MFHRPAFRRLLLSTLILLFPVAAFSASNCNLAITASCTPDGQGGLSCTSETTNQGGSCSGFVYALWYAPDSAAGDVTISEPESNFPFDFCFGDDGQVEDIFPYALCVAQDATISAGHPLTTTVTVRGASSPSELFAATLVAGENDEDVASAFTSVGGTSTSCTPVVSAPPVVPSGAVYTVSWTAVPDGSAQYIIEESGSPDFSNPTTRQVNGLSTTFLHDDMATTTKYYYRVRATHCNGAETPFSLTAETIVLAEKEVPADDASVAVPFGSTEPFTFEIFVPPPPGTTALGTTFTASMDKPFLGVNPKTGTFPAGGLTLTITGRPKDLPAGANTGTLNLVLDTAGAAGNIETHSASSVKIPVSISLVTPVAPGSKTFPPPNTLIIPVVTHVNVTAGQFLSDVRLTNTNAGPVTYQITLSPTQSDARTNSKITQVTVAKDQTVALNDVVKNFFGFGATSNPADIGFGALEIRPLSSATRTYASSRTYAKTLNGTFGQFVAAMPMTKFATRAFGGVPLPGQPQLPASKVLSLQQVSQSAKFRTNLGIVEGSGQPANGRIRIFDHLGTMRKEVPFALRPGEHKQMNRFISDPNQGNIATLEEGRIEIEIDSEAGAVTAYASVLDNITTDPLAVMPVDASLIRARRYVIPGMAELPNRVDNFHSDMRVFNGGASNVNATFTFYPMGGGAPSAPQQRSIAAGEMLVLDNILPSMFGASNTGGSVVVTTPGDSSLVLSGRTYTVMDNGGTFGQFIPGLNAAEGIGRGDLPLEVLQLEHSARFRTNFGLAELTGNPVEVEIAFSTPEGKATTVTRVNLAANEFRQLNGVLASIFGTEAQTYNARITVQAVSGNGRVTAYGSVIDNESKDPTYIPAQ